jgi:hypothetical protein
MTQYRDNYPYNIESPQKVYIEYSHDIQFDYSTGKYPDGTEKEWNWESNYIPIKHNINGLEVGRHEWMRIKVGDLNNWTYPIRISANITNISSISEEILIENEEYTEFVIVLTFEDGSTISSEPIRIKNGKDGVEIVSSQINEEGRLIITYSDGRVEDAGQARGQDAEDLPPAVDDDYILSQSGGVVLWVAPEQVVANVLSATSPIEYDLGTATFSHNNDDGNRHVPIGGSNGFILSTDGTGNYSWTDPTELDPTVPQWVKDITQIQITNWDTAYGWGDHSLAGYLEDVIEGTNITIDKTDPNNPIINASAGLTALPIGNMNSDLTSDLDTTGTKGYYTLPFNCTFNEAITSLFEAPTGSAFLTDILLNGITILNSDISITAGTKTASTTSFATSTGSKGDEITLEFSQVGAINTGKGHLAWLIVTPS